MGRVGFFTAVHFGGQPKTNRESLLETVDAYFYLGGKKACVISGSSGVYQAALQDHSISWTVLAAKIASYATIVLPVIAMILKVVLRSTSTFHLSHSANAQQKQNPQTTTMHTGANLASRSVVAVVCVNNNSLKENKGPEGAALEQELPDPYASVRSASDISDVEEFLGQGIDVSQATIEKIQSLFEIIVKHEADPNITYLSGPGRNIVFSVNSEPRFVFKTAADLGNVREQGLLPDALVELRFTNMIMAVAICADKHLNHLIVPHAKKLEINSKLFIAEERLDVPKACDQEDVYLLSGLDETIRQLACFVTQAGFGDMEWRNAPVLDRASGFERPRRVALIDLEEIAFKDHDNRAFLRGAQNGIFGNDWPVFRRGLINCVHSENHIDIILDELSKSPDFLEITTSSDKEMAKYTMEQAKNKRMQEIEKDARLRQFYDNKGIFSNPEQQIQVEDLSSLELNLEEEMRGAGFTLRKAAEDVIKYINASITKHSKDESVKFKRCVLFNRDSEGLDPKYILPVLSEESWIEKILSALRRKGYIFSYLKSADMLIEAQV